ILLSRAFFLESITRTLFIRCLAAHPLLVSILPPPPRFTLFPYTTLFRSLSSGRPKGSSWRSTRSALTVSAWHPSTMPVSGRRRRSEEHTSELQSRENLVCRLLLEKKKRNQSKSLLAHSSVHVRRLYTQLL